jgi:hypothetical protein
MYKKARQITRGTLDLNCEGTDDVTVEQYFTSSIFGRLCYFVEEPLRIWVRNPDAIIEERLHVEERDGRRGLCKTVKEYRQNFAEHNIGEWDLPREVWWFDTDEQLAELAELAIQAEQARVIKGRARGERGLYTYGNPVDALRLFINMLNIAVVKEHAPDADYPFHACRRHRRYIRCESTAEKRVVFLMAVKEKMAPNEHFLNHHAICRLCVMAEYAGFLPEEITTAWDISSMALDYVLESWSPPWQHPRPRDLPDPCEEEDEDDDQG